MPIFNCGNVLELSGILKSVAVRTRIRYRDLHNNKYYRSLIHQTLVEQRKILLIDWKQVCEIQQQQNSRITYCLLEKKHNKKYLTTFLTSEYYTISESEGQSVFWITNCMFCRLVGLHVFITIIFKYWISDAPDQHQCLFYGYVVGNRSLVCSLFQLDSTAKSPGLYCAIDRIWPRPRDNQMTPSWRPKRGTTWYRRDWDKVSLAPEQSPQDIFPWGSGSWIIGCAGEWEFNAPTLLRLFNAPTRRNLFIW